MPVVALRGLLGSLLVLGGGLFYAPTPLRHGAPTGVFAPLEAAPRHLLIGVCVGLLGLLLLTWAWWTLRAQVRGRSDGVRRVRLVAGLWSLPLLCAPPLFSGDGWSYVATGYLTRLGWSPYVWTPAVLPEPLRSGVDPRWLNTPTPYGALPLEWGAGFAHLTANPWLLLYAYRLLALIGLVLVAWAVPRLAGRAGQDPAEASALVVASPFMLAHGVGGLHNDLIMVGLMLVALVLTRRDRWLLGAALAGFAAAVKAPGALVAVGVVLVSLPALAGMAARLRRTAAVGVVASATLVGTGWVSGLGLGWLHALIVPTNERTPFAVTDQVGLHLHRLLHALGGAPLVHEVQPIPLSKHLGLAVLVAVALWTLVWRRHGGEVSALRGTALVLATATVLSPAVHYWYALWCLPLLACLRLGPRARAAVVAMIAVLGPLAVADPALHQKWLVRVAVDALVAAPLLAWLLAGRLPSGWTGRFHDRRTGRVPTA